MIDQDTIDKLQINYPEVIGAVITKRDDTVNLCPVNFQAVSTKFEAPLCVCIGLNNQGYTLETILQTKEFVYAYPSKSQLREVMRCGAVSGRDFDKLAQISLQFTESKAVDSPSLQDAVVNYECRLVHSYNAGDFTILVGSIKHVSPSGHDKLDKIYCLGDQRYGTIRPNEILQEGRDE